MKKSERSLKQCQIKEQCGGQQQQKLKFQDMANKLLSIIKRKFKRSLYKSQLFRIPNDRLQNNQKVGKEFQKKFS